MRKWAVIAGIVVALIIVVVVIYFLHFTDHFENSSGEFQPMSHSHLMDHVGNATDEVVDSIHTRAQEHDKKTKANFGDRADDLKPVKNTSSKSSFSNSTAKRSSGSISTNVVKHKYFTRSVDSNDSKEKDVEQEVPVTHNTLIGDVANLPSKAKMILQKSRVFIEREQSKKYAAPKETIQSKNTASSIKSNARTSKGSSITPQQTLTVAQRSETLPDQQQMQQAIRNKQKLLLALGKLEYAQNRMVLSATKSGEISSLHSNGNVEKGTLLYSLNNPGLQNTIIAIEVKLKHLNTQLTILRKGNSTIETDKKDAELRLEILLLQEKLFAYKNSLRQTRFYAPYAGTFTATVDLGVGSQLQEGTSIGTLQGAKQLAAVGTVVAVPENHLVLGQPVIVSSVAQDSKLYPAAIAAIDKSNQTGYTIHAVLQGSDVFGLKKGDMVKMRVLLP